MLHLWWLECHTPLSNVCCCHHLDIGIRMVEKKVTYYFHICMFALGRWAGREGQAGLG